MQRERSGTSALKLSIFKSGIALLFHSAKGRRNGFQIKAITHSNGLALVRQSPWKEIVETSPQQRFDITRTYVPGTAVASHSL